MIPYHTRYVGGPIGRTFRKWGWAGVTLPIPFWGAVVVMWDQGQTNILELRHEILGHIPQIERLGSFRYLATIFYQYIRYGHDRAPLEIEACQVAERDHAGDNA